MWTNQKVSGIMQVVMAQWIDPEPHDWPQYASRLRQLWHNPKWCRSIFVDDAPVPGVTHTRNLHSRLQHIAARACGVCDPQAHRPFPSNTALTKHVTAQHHQHMCTVCLDVSLNLPARTLMLLQAELWATALHGSLPVLLAWTGKVYFFALFCMVQVLLLCLPPLQQLLLLLTRSCMIKPVHCSPASITTADCILCSLFVCLRLFKCSNHHICFLCPLVCDVPVSTSHILSRDAHSQLQRLPMLCCMAFVGLALPPMFAQE